MSLKPKKRIPFEFVLELLAPLEPQTKPMFGSHGVYVGEKIVFILRDRESWPQDNGLWLCTQAEHHESLRKSFPTMHHLELFESGPTNWQVLPSSSPDFEEKATLACELVLKGDERIGRIPASRKKKLTAKKKRPSRKKKR
jgi:hypothetical protein